MSNLTTAHKLMVLAFAWLLLSGGGIASAPPPFKADKLCVLIVHEGEDRDDGPKDLPLILNGQTPGTVRGIVSAAGGEFRAVDVSNPPVRDAQWVQDAFTVSRQSLPWIVASNGRRGVSAPLPATEAEAAALIAPLGAKQ